MSTGSCVQYGHPCEDFDRHATGPGPSVSCDRNVFVRQPMVCDRESGGIVPQGAPTRTDCGDRRVCTEAGCVIRCTVNGDCASSERCAANSDGAMVCTYSPEGGPCSPTASRSNTEPLCRAGEACLPVAYDDMVRHRVDSGLDGSLDSAVVVDGGVTAAAYRCQTACGVGTSHCNDSQGGCCCPTSRQGASGACGVSRSACVGAPCGDGTHCDGTMCVVD